MGKKQVDSKSPSSVEAKPISAEHQSIVEWLKKVRFRKQLFGGVNEEDVWKKIDELNKRYETALAAERIRYETLLEQRETQCSRSEERMGDG